MAKQLKTPKDRRDLYVEEVKKKILGPGFAEDVYEYPDLEHEIINQSPNLIYYTGVLFPEESDTTTTAHSTITSQQNSSVEYGNTDEDEDLLSDSQDVEEDTRVNEDAQLQSMPDTTREESSESDDWRTTLKPSHIGLITSVDPCASVQASISYAKYERISPVGVKAKLGGVQLSSLLATINAYDNEASIRKILSDNHLGSLAEIFLIDGSARTITLKQMPLVTVVKNGNVSRRPLQTSDFPKQTSELYDERILKLFGKLFTTMYQRVPVNIPKFNVDLNDKKQERKDIPGCSDLVYVTKIFPIGNKTYLKVIIINCTNDQKLFQSKVTLYSNGFSSYHDFNLSGFDRENEENEYIYRDELDFGKGVGCAVEWDEVHKHPEWIATTYTPLVAVKKFSNDANTKYDANIASYCRLYDLSIWGNESDIIPNLNKFVDAYLAWHNDQIRMANTEPQYKSISNNILTRQKTLYSRLKDNVNFLASNEEALECFKIANTAMYIQMVVSRDPVFKKNRELCETIRNLNFDDINFFKGKKSSTTPTYRPFQLAFLILNIKPTMDSSDPYRDVVDLIWFPTGGGKTEAYLALTAFTISYRRRYGTHNNIDVSGVSVIMRYTLRLLTSQQFERASFLICALDFLRKKCSTLDLGSERISIGMWIGGASTPNSVKALKEKKSSYENFFSSINSGCLPKGNPFPLAYCPWCGTKLVSTDNSNIQKGYGEDGTLHCTNYDCHFNDGLPIDYIDELIYDNPPTLLFATVDKFANIYLSKAGKLFGVKTSRCRPDLIIQDELHLVSGPLGSMVGLFETVVEELCKNGNSKPRIIASTATTRNTEFLIKQLYRREVSVFPASGIRYDDNYFSHVEVGNNKRLHLGIVPTGQKSVMTEIDLVAILVVSKFKLIVQTLKEQGVSLFDKNAVLQAITDNHISGDKDVIVSNIDDFWTLVLYYNSLKDLGRSKSRIPQEIMERIRVLYSYTENYESLDFILRGIDQRNREFTSREDSSRIKDLLTEAESRTKLAKSNSGNWRIASKMDIVQASNMISVGIDIPRWNLMVMVGQPRSTAEYIQSSSRVARTVDGLVINLMNPNRNREYSLFENYTSFHRMYYKYVEPLSATPFTEMTLDKMLANMVIAYMKHCKCLTAKDVDKNAFQDFKDFINNAQKIVDPTDIQLRTYINSSVDKINAAWSKTISPNVDYKDIQDLFELSSSMRSVDANSAIMIKDIDY